MNIIKRSGEEQDFRKEKIRIAVGKANATVNTQVALSEAQISGIADAVEEYCRGMNRALSVEEVQDRVETEIMKAGAYEVAKEYITYRYQRSLVRHANTTDAQILSLIEANNEEVKQENANKNPTINAVQRDYMAGEVSKDVSKRLLLPAEIVEAHNQGLIHFHDMDYFAQHMHESKKHKPLEEWLSIETTEHGKDRNQMMQKSYIPVNTSLELSNFKSFLLQRRELLLAKLREVLK